MPPAAHTFFAFLPEQFALSRGITFDLSVHGPVLYSPLPFLLPSRRGTLPLFGGGVPGFAHRTFMPCCARGGSMFGYRPPGGDISSFGAHLCVWTFPRCYLLRRWCNLLAYTGPAKMDGTGMPA